MVMIETIRKYLVSMKWKVTPMRKAALDYNEMVVRIDDVDIQPETNYTYIANVYVALEYNTMNGDAIPTQIISLVSQLEHKIVEDSTETCKVTFRFAGSQVTDLGELYRVSILVYYREVINIGY